MFEYAYLKHSDNIEYTRHDYAYSVSGAALLIRTPPSQPNIQY